MLRINTPIEDYTEEYGLWVKREDLACKKPGPPFSKTRGVFERVASRPEKVIGVLDTSHSQAGHAVARACQILKKDCINFYPKYKADQGKGLKNQQLRAEKLGARIVPLQAGRSCILFHQAKKLTEKEKGYMMPNALKLEESIVETAKEVDYIEESVDFEQVLIPISSGTIAAGVIKGFLDHNWEGQFLIHMGYDRSEEQVLKYLQKGSGYDKIRLKIINEKYSYKDESKPGKTPSFPCNKYYDLKAFRWWMLNKERFKGDTLLWNIG